MSDKLDMLLTILVSILAIPAIAFVTYGFSLVAAFARDLRRTPPDAVNLQAVADVVGASRWPNLVWRRHMLITGDLPAMKRRFFALGAVLGGALMLVLVLGSIVALGYWLLSGVKSMPIPAAIVAGAIIIAIAMRNRTD